MSAISKYWLEDLMLLSIGIAIFNAALTGEFYGGRGGRRLASVKSAPARIVFLSISICIFVLFVWILRHQLGSQVRR
jgi:hypothetical protein